MSVKLCGVCEQSLPVDGVVIHAGGEDHPFHINCVELMRALFDECPVCCIPKEQFQFPSQPIKAEKKDIDWRDPVEVDNKIRRVAQNIKETSGVIKALEHSLQFMRAQERLTHVKEKLLQSQVASANRQEVEAGIKCVEEALSIVAECKQKLQKEQELYQGQMDCLQVMQELNLADPLQVDKLIQASEKTITVCKNSIAALHAFEAVNQPRKKLEIIQKQLNPEEKPSPEVTADIEFICERLNLAKRLKTIYTKMWTEAEERKQFLEGVKRASTLQVVLLSDKLVAAT